MKIAGIISEFNPFHNGHKYIIDQIKKENDCLVTVMSGNFVQRGEPAFLDKHPRAHAALKAGVDLVVELPSPWSASFAGNFAFGAVSLLKELNIQSLYFGSETNDIEALETIAKIDEELKPGLFGGITFAKGREQELSKIKNIDSSLLKGANNNLAIEYIKARNKLNCDFQVKCIERIDSIHDSDIKSENICSASYLRNNFSKENALKYIPVEALAPTNDEISKGYYIDYERFSIAVITYLRRLKDFSNLPDISEGIENKLKKEIQNAKDYNELIFSIKSKRYPLARIRRLILSAFLDMDNSYSLKPVPYINVLGMTKKGEEIIKFVAQNSNLPIIMSGKSSKPLDKETELLLNNEYIRNDIYSSLLKSSYPCGRDLRSRIIKN